MCHNVSLGLQSMTSALHAFYLLDIHGRSQENWRVTSRAITFHHTIPPGSKQADISFPGFPFDLARLHAHQSLPCSKWRIPHTLDYLMQLANSPQRKRFVYEGLVLS